MRPLLTLMLATLLMASPILFRDDTGLAEPGTPPFTPLRTTTVYNSEGLGGQVAGNWGGPEGKGSYFLVEFGGWGNAVQIRISDSADAPPRRDGPPALEFSSYLPPAIFARTDIWVDAEDRPDGTVVQLIISRNSAGDIVREVVELQLVDAQYTVTGYILEGYAEETGPSQAYYRCKVDPRAGISVVGGAERRFPPTSFDALDIRNWFTVTAVERGWCLLPEAP